MTDKMGGAAFPRPASTDEHEQPCNVYQDQQGMTLWDYYAAAAVSGFVEQTTGVCDAIRAAEVAASIADAMLIERAKRMEGEQ